MYLCYVKFPEIIFKKMYLTLVFNLMIICHTTVGFFSIGLYFVSVFFMTPAIYMHKPSAFTGANLMESIDICADSVYQALPAPTPHECEPGFNAKISVLKLHLYLHSLA